MALKSRLRDMSMIIDLGVGASMTNGWSLFTLQFELTEKGVTQYEYILKALFQYIGYLKEVCHDKKLFDFF